VNTKDGDTKKAFIRNQIFQEVDDSNKKLGQLKTSTIKSVIWPVKGKFTEMETSAWLALAEENSFWNLS
jgi:hypothetical protein